MRVHINAARCAEYLRGVGLSVPDEVRDAWLAQEWLCREQAKANRNELKKSCGHFASSWCIVRHSGGRTDVRSCDVCQKPLEYRGVSLNAEGAR